MNIRFYISLAVLMGISMLATATPSDTLTVKVLGTAEDARFEPVVLQVEPGDVIRFKVIEGLHTVTAYHPNNRRPQRIPDKATSFDSGMLTAGQTWYLKLEEKGVYDYFCLPHERMGHAGRILVGEVNEIPNYPAGRIPGSIIEMLKHETEKVFP
ncbi:cupredoxin domain-containing protein [Gracilimonas halophila]|uniref:Plastocyanin/azurin family copper-binding protein n=1 Tax=Gracilimonas halophila TaxID=1834464 RepID=A0ABW5JK81_9BACT